MTLANLPPPNGFTRGFRRVCAVLAFAFFLGLVGLSSFEIIASPPVTTYLFLLLVAGFVDPAIAGGLIEILKGKGK
ncbi:MAG: hypothetical protein AAF903_12200 [Pseudomonadota bacterium]